MKKTYLTPVCLLDTDFSDADILTMSNQNDAALPTYDWRDLL